MNSSNNINLKNQTDITDLEICSFNEEEEQFINKKQLVHIDDDTSINVDISDDDRSKSSTLKKSFLINNISAFNEQFQMNNQIENKKEENENDLNDLSNSADFYNNDNGVGNFPLIMSDRSKEIINSKNINNDDMMQSLGTNIDNNGYFFSKKNELSDGNNNRCSTNKKINIKNNGLNMSIKDIDDEEEEELDENNNIKMMLQKKMTPYNTINGNKNKISNNYNNSKNMKQNMLQVNNFCLYILGSNKYNGSVNTSEQTFGLLQSQSKDFQNKYTQLESKYNALLEQNRKLKESYEELKSSNKSVLDLLTYWQKFYLEILEIVKPKTNKNDISISDYMDDPYRIQVINDVKKIVLISRDKAYSKFYISQINNFEIKGKENKDINLGNKNSDKNSGRNSGISNINNNHKKYLNEDDDLNSLPPIRYNEKINKGVNTEIIGENNNNTQPIIKEIIKEVEVVKKIPNQKFEEKKLKISSKVHNFSFAKTLPQKQELKRNNSGKLPNYKKLKSNLTSSNSNSNSKSNLKDIDKKNTLLKICSSIKINFKSTPPKTPKKLKKNVMHKVAMIQTDMTYKNINSIEALNKACSSQLLNSQREKEKMQKLYEEKISSLNDYINENIKLAKKEKNKKISKNKENNNNNKIKDENLLKNKNDEDPSSNMENQFIFIPEMIPPENTYKIFMHCVKHFKYEEDIYKKYLEEEDLKILKNFVEKMEKYLIETSLPVLKNNKKAKKEKSEKKIIIDDSNSNNYKYIKPENYTNKKYKENYRNTNGKMKPLNAKLKISYNSENNIDESESKKNSVYNNNNTFNKYKAAILALKDY